MEIKLFFFVTVKYFSMVGLFSTIYSVLEPNPLINFLSILGDTLYGKLDDKK